MATKEYDVLIVGAGFGGITTMVRLRRFGMKCHILEKGNGPAGIWYWNCYPGARVDSDTPIYQLFDKDVYNDWAFTERYPGWQELRRYFKYLDEKLDINKDVTYGAEVKGASFDENTKKWTVECTDGSKAVAKWFIPAIGFAAKKYVPPYKGIENFKGIVEHTATWPQEGVELKGKRVAVIGTGASGIQTTQECGGLAKELTLYQRTPNLCLPMNQKPMTKEYVENLKKTGEFEKSFKLCHETFAGFNYDFLDKKTFDDSPEERQKLYNHLMNEMGGFAFWLHTYSDMLFDEAANTEAYNFWRDQVRKRIKDPKKVESLAPTKPPHPWGTKRPSLEQNFYEVMSQDNVDLIDLQLDPIEEFTATGIRTKSGLHKEFDVIALATGFDSVTGSLAQLDIRGIDGSTIAQHWADGLKSAIGIALNKFPNMFFLYGPQAPTAFSNGPSCVQVQAEFLEALFKRLLDEKVTRLEAKPEVEDEWRERNHEIWNKSLFPKAKSWYQGANIPGKRVEPLNWPGGIPAYIQALDDTVANNYQGWFVAKD